MNKAATRCANFLPVLPSEEPFLYQLRAGFGLPVANGPKTTLRLTIPKRFVFGTVMRSPRSTRQTRPKNMSIYCLASLYGPEVAKLSPSAIWYPLERLSRKRCSGTQGEQGETPAFAGLGTRNFPEEG